jgi:hypothetical protein
MARKSLQSSSFCIIMVALFLSIVAGLLFLFFSHNIQMFGMGGGKESAAGKEKFNNTELLSPNKLVVYQGNTLPDGPLTAVEFDNHESLPTVDGTGTTPRSMFALAFNKCDPSCCPSTYSCSGGCVCMTDKQQNFIGSRGNNNKSGCKLNDNAEY